MSAHGNKSGSDKGFRPLGVAKMWDGGRRIGERVGEVEGPSTLRGEMH